MYVIINQGNNISGWDTLFYDRVKKSDLGNRGHVIKNLHRGMIFGPFEICFHESSLWRGHRAVTSFILTKEYLCIYFVMGISFITDK